MNVFVSYSFGTDEIVAQSLNNVITKTGHQAFKHDAFTKQLRCLEARGTDRLDLDIAFRRAGYSSSTQERSDPEMFRLLISHIAAQDALIVLWCDEYARKYWTRIEWKTALAMCKPLVVIQMDATPISAELKRALDVGGLPIIEFGQDYEPIKVTRLLDGLKSMPEGKFLTEIYDEETDHRFVRLQHPFLGDIEIGKFEVTYNDVLNVAPHLMPELTRASMQEKNPVTNITWQQACSLCQAMGKKAQDRYLRLPSEIEWEFAARAGQLTVSGLPMDNFKRYAVVNSEGPAPVGSKEPNGWGLFDMVGNVAEWCLDAGELLEINGWVQPVEGSSLSRAHVVRGAYYGTRPNPRLSVSYPYPQLNDLCSPAMGMRLVRQLKNDKEGARS